jgi:hypothetical protein
VLAIGLGLGIIADGCGTPSGTPAQNEKVPEAFVKLKESMKERAVAKKGRTGGAPGTPAGR